MGNLCRLIWYALIGMFQSRAALEAEILVLRHQLNVLRRSCPKRVALNSVDRLLLYRLAPATLDALKIITPATLLRWHRAGFRTGRISLPPPLQLITCPVMKPGPTACNLLVFRQPD